VCRLAAALVGLVWWLRAAAGVPIEA